MERMETKKYTFDLIRQDSQYNKILIRYAYENEDECDKFDSLLEVRICCSRGNLKRNIYLSTDILSDILQ